jgi:hypothetical protein
VLRIQGIEVDDDDGDDDGLLEAGEEAELTLTVGNVGDLDTFGSLDAVLSLGPGTEVDAAITDDEDGASTISAGYARDFDGFSIAVADGEPGQAVELVLTLDDGEASYEATATLLLGEPAWLSLDTADDPTGDAIDDYAWDYQRGYWRVVDGRMELWLSSAVSYDPETLFIEAWAESSAADYTYYRLVLQSGIARVQGYLSGVGFTTIATAEVEELSETDLVLSFDTTELGLLVDQLRIGFAAGWCGPDEYFCDHYPDGWGYPYDTWTSADWFTLSW